MASGTPGDILSDAVKRAKERAQELAAKGPPGLGAGMPYNGGEDMNSRKRPLDEMGHPGNDGPLVKKPTIDNYSQPGNVTIPPVGTADPQVIAQAAIAKVGAQLGLTQMITIEIKIPNRMVGLVIGRQGEMINRLQADSGARIQVAPDGSEVAGERQVTICGTTETVERAKALVNKVVEDAGGAISIPMGGGGLPGGGGGDYSFAPPPMQHLEAGQEVMELMIPANKVGLVIGKSGEMIKALQERAGCKMQMIQDGQFSNAPEKPLRMTGMPESCKKARELVLQLIEQKELEARGLTGGDFQKSIPQTIEVQVPKPLVGFVIGRNGEHINNIQNTCGVRLQFQNDIPGTDYRIATIAGPPDACMRAKKMVEEIVAERQQMGGFKPRLELPNPTGPGVQTVQFPVPGGKCGLVIGKGGETIRAIQVQSGAHVELHRGAQPNPHEKLFNIRGLPQQIQHAQQLIRQKCDMMSPGGGFQQQMPGMAYSPGQMYGSPQQAAAYGGAQSSASPWAQYSYPQAAYGAAAAQQQSSDPSHQAAWTAYYQQLYAAQAQAQAQAQAGQQAAAQQPQGQPGASGQDLQAQWAEYYRQLGYAYYGQGGGAGAGGQPGQSPGGATSGSSGEQK